MAYFTTAATLTTPFGGTPVTMDSVCVCLGSTRAKGLAFSTSSNVAMVPVPEMKLLKSITPVYCPYSTATESPPGPSQDLYSSWSAIYGQKISSLLSSTISSTIGLGLVVSTHQGGAQSITG